MLTRISLALFTSATFHLGRSTSPGGREHGHVPEELGRHWEQARGRAAAQRRVLPGIPYQTLRKELVNEKTLQRGEASKESLQECFCHRQQLNYHVLSTDSSPGWELSMTLRWAEYRGVVSQVPDTRHRELRMICCGMRHDVGQEGPVTHGNGATPGKNPTQQQTGHRAQCI